MGLAFGLAVTLHIVLLAFLFAGARDHQTASAGPQMAVSGSVEPLMLAVPVPRMDKRSWASGLTGKSRLVAANNQAPLARHRNTAVKPEQRRGLDLRIARAGATLRAPRTAEPSVAQQRNRSLDRERAARLAALQAMAGRPLLDGGHAALAAYASQVARRVRANVLAPFDIEGNPSAVVAVTCTPSGALLSVTVQRPSGNPQWDRAVVAAIEDSEPMPADGNGSTPTSFVMTLRPKG